MPVNINIRHNLVIANLLHPRFLVFNGHMTSRCQGLFSAPLSGIGVIYLIPWGEADFRFLRAGLMPLLPRVRV